MENRKAILSDQLIQRQALKFANEMKIDKFTASKGWLLKWKKRAAVKQYSLPGEAGSADSVNAAGGRDKHYYSQLLEESWHSAW